MSRLQVDWTRCDGHGLCAELLPSVVTRDEWGYPVIAPAPVDEQDARRAVALCPALALRIAEAAR